MDNDTQAMAWFKQAAIDLDSSMNLSTTHPVPIENICSLCHQSAEKSLKGYLVLHGADQPQIHDLEALCKLCMKFSDTFSEIAGRCSGLSAYGSQPENPMGQKPERDMLQALEDASTIHFFIMNLMLQED